MICLLHGYLLEGSGSNLWTRAVVRALCAAGETVHLVCQEPHPEDYDFIAAAQGYDPDGTLTALMSDRATPYAGRCVMHKPRLGDTLPVYVADDYEEFRRAVPMIELGDDAIEDYLARNTAVVERVVREAGVTVLHANHAVLMAVVAARVGDATGVPFAVMPHGSAIEYAVKKDSRFHAFAADALDLARLVFVIGKEMRARVLDTFADVPGIERKLDEVVLGVDTAAFTPVGRDGRAGSIAHLKQGLAPLARGRQPETGDRLRSRLRPVMARAELTEALGDARRDDGKKPDAGLEARLDDIDWQRDDVVLYVGRLIAGKGLHGLIAALPDIFEARPAARLIVVGHGPQRVVMEALLWALEHGARDLARNIAEWGAALEGAGFKESGPGENHPHPRSSASRPHPPQGGREQSAPTRDITPSPSMGEGWGGGDSLRPDDTGRPYETLRRYFDALESAGKLDAYFETARRVVRAERVLFAGYLTHAELRHLLPCADVAVFPSVVAEAGPLVFLEALAAGCFPLGTYFAGMGASIDAVAGPLPPGDAALMKLDPDPANTVRDIAANVPAALALGGRHGDALRQAVVARNDWRGIANRLAAALHGMTGPDHRTPFGRAEKETDEPVTG